MSKNKAKAINNVEAVNNVEATATVNNVEATNNVENVENTENNVFNNYSGFTQDPTYKAMEEDLNELREQLEATNSKILTSLIEAKIRELEDSINKFKIEFIINDLLKLEMDFIDTLSKKLIQSKIVEAEHFQNFKNSFERIFRALIVGKYKSNNNRSHKSNNSNITYRITYKNGNTVTVSTLYDMYLKCNDNHEPLNSYHMRPFDYEPVIKSYSPTVSKIEKIQNDQVIATVTR